MVNKSTWVRAAALAVLLFSLVPGTGRAHHLGADPSQIPLTLRPSDAQGNPIAGPGYFDFNAASGTTTSLYAIVGNEGVQAAKARLVAVDATSGVFGGVSYHLPQQPRKAVGTWVKLTTKTVSLEPGKGLVVRFTVMFPAGTKPGQYVGGLTAYVPMPRAKNGGFGGIQLQTRVVDAIEVTVPGPLEAHLVVNGMSPQKRLDATYLLVHMTNTGNVLLKGQANLQVYPPGSTKPILATTISLDTTVPQTRVHYPLSLGRNPKVGMYHYTVTLTWVGGSIETLHLSWKGGKVVRRGHFTIKDL